eukprot:TRINITY_DN7259_c0_g1_i3.p1 TRINITY_DN7259_c0_g1~~TRINITY_DN7259_c0_g1_i3.p1  ORF type:complete len:574 (+),score=87.91 TRINITY_DN7259_c0_g1_i3:137-1858(+)
MAKHHLGNATSLPNIDAKYSKVRTIGIGAFGKAWLAKQQSTNKEFCMKEMSIDNEQAMMEARSEAQVHAHLKHPFIIQFEEVVKTPTMVYIVMEYADQGDLATLLDERSASKRHLPEEQLMVWMTQILQALAYIHRRGMIHRDVKSANIFLMRSGVVKLGDMGCARVLEDNASRIDMRTCASPCGTPLYQAPEQTKGTAYTQKVDIWALGCVLYEACTLKPTFEARDIRELAHKIRNGMFQKRLPNVYTPQLRSLVLELLTIDDYLRPSARALLKETYFKDFVHKRLSTTSGKVEDIDTSKTATTASASPQASPSGSRHPSARPNIAPGNASRQSSAVSHAATSARSPARTAIASPTRTSPRSTTHSPSRTSPFGSPVGSRYASATSASKRWSMDMPINTTNEASSRLAKRRGSNSSMPMQALAQQHSVHQQQAANNVLSRLKEVHTMHSQTSQDKRNQPTSSTMHPPAFAASMPVRGRPANPRNPIPNLPTYTDDAQGPVLDRLGRVVPARSLARDDRRAASARQSQPSGPSGMNTAAAWNVPTGISLKPQNYQRGMPSSSLFQSNLQAFRE